MKLVDPKNPPALPPDAEEYLTGLKLDRETTAYAKFIFAATADKTVQDQDDARREAQRIERVEALERTTTAALGGEYGKVAQDAATRTLADASLGRIAKLETIGRIVASERKRMFAEARNNRGKWAP